jgi:hypothetical protein
MGICLSTPRHIGSLLEIFVTQSYWDIVPLDTKLWFNERGLLYHEPKPVGWSDVRFSMPLQWDLEVRTLIMQKVYAYDSRYTHRYCQNNIPDPPDQKTLEKWK